MLSLGGWHGKFGFSNPGSLPAKIYRGSSGTCSIWKPAPAADELGSKCILAATAATIGAGNAATTSMHSMQSSTSLALFVALMSERRHCVQWPPGRDLQGSTAEVHFTACDLDDLIYL